MFFESVLLLGLYLAVPGEEEEEPSFLLNDDEPEVVSKRSWDPSKELL